MSQLTLVPRVSEKTIAQAERGTYVFEVPRDSNKVEVAKAVEAAFKVKVADVNMMVVKGKAINVRTRGRSVAGRRRDLKKAMVTLQKGHKIGLFEEGK